MLFTEFHGSMKFYLVLINCFTNFIQLLYNCFTVVLSNQNELLCCNRNYKTLYYWYYLQLNKSYTIVIQVLSNYKYENFIFASLTKPKRVQTLLLRQLMNCYTSYTCCASHARNNDTIGKARHEQESWNPWSDTLD